VSTTAGHAAAGLCRGATATRAGAHAREGDDADAGRATSEDGPKVKPKPTKRKKSDFSFIINIF
jgi:hypothetical protein